MKKNILKKLGGLFLGLTMGLGIAVGVTAGQEVKEVKATDTTFDLSNNVPTGLTAAGATLNKDSTRGMGASKASFTLTTTNSYTSVSSITVQAATNYGGTLSANTISATVGGSSFGSAVGMTSKDLTDYTLSGTAASGVVVVSINNGDTGNKNSIWVKSIKITTGGGGETSNYTVTFDANGHGTAPSAATVVSGGKVTKPTDPSASGYTFGGWFKETGCTNEYDFNTAVTSSFTLYAKWTEESGGGGDATGSYTLVTSLSDLKNGDSVVIATDEPADGVTGVTGFNGNKDATVSTTLSEFLEYSVEVSGGNYYLKDDGANNYIASPGGKEFKYGTKGAISVDADGHMMSNSRYLCVNGSNYRFYGSIGSYTPFYLYKLGQLATLKSISTLSGTVSAKTGDTSWKIENVLVTGVLSDSASVVDVSKYVDVSVTQAVPAITADGTMSVTLKATGKTETTVTKSVSVTATLKYVNPYDISQIYGAADNTVVTIDGIYMGDVRDAMIIMDGEYGANIYYGTGKVPAHSYVPGETKLTVTGTTSLYKGLEEVKPTSVSVLTDADRIAKLSTPEVYICTGNETSANPELASRKTNATGYVTAIADASGNKNVTLSVSGKSVAIFVGSVYATEDVMSKLNASKDNTTDIVVEGFTSFYNGNFQIQFTGLVEQKVDYLAADFAQDLLDLTDAVCTGYNGVTNNKNALNSVWLTLQDADHYLGLAGTEKAILASTTANVNGTTTEKAMARYDYLCVKYELTNFVERTLPLGSRIVTVSNRTNNNSAITAIIAISLVSISTLGVLIIIKKRKTITK